MTIAIKHLDKMRSKALLGGGKKRIQKQHDKGRMTARERVAYLIDKDDDFFAKPRAIAEEIYKTVKQDKSTWSFRVELRPFGEYW